MPAIGLLNEKPLHASLKQWCARSDDQLEMVVDGFVIDIVRDGLLLEIQTRSFHSIRAKLTRLARSHPIRLIYPIAKEKWIVKPGRDGESRRRKSPRAGRVEDLFLELVSCSQLLAEPNFSLEVLMINEEEARRFDRKRGWRRRGWVTVERRLLEVVERRVFEGPADWRALLPEGLGSFTAADLADALGIGRELARRMVYCLRRAAVIDQVGKRGRAKLYSMGPSAEGRPPHLDPSTTRAARNSGSAA
jgi:hypothetical protein